MRSAVLGTPRREQHSCSGMFSRIYDFYIERESLAQLIGRSMWGVDLAPMYTSMRAIGQLADGATILDVPCGGGVAFRGLRTGQDVRYIAVDLSADMLGRARSRAEALALEQVEIVAADMRALPFPNAIADLCLSYNGLHAAVDPAETIAEIIRCLKPGCELVGSMFLLDGGRRQQVLIRHGRRWGEFGRCGTAAELRGWLAVAGITDVTIEPERGLAVFRGRKDDGKLVD